MTFRISGLDPQTFSHFFALDEHALAALGVKRYIVDAADGFPDRISLCDAPVGSSVLLLNYTHQPAATPFHACHAIFVGESGGAGAPFDNEIPPSLRKRTLSIRAFDHEHNMVDADLCEGRQANVLIERLFSDPAIDYLQAHYARRGCFAAQINRL